MATQLNISYGSKVNIGITLEGLADGEWRQSDAVDNSSNKYLDALVGGFIKTGAGSGAGDYVDVYVSGSIDDGATFGGDCSGSDDAYGGEDKNLTFLKRIHTEAENTTFEFGPWSIAAAFGGVLPRHWVLVFDNESDSTLDGTGSNHEVHYQGIMQQAS